MLAFFYMSGMLPAFGRILRGTGAPFSVDGHCLLVTFVVDHVFVFFGYPLWGSLYRSGTCLNTDAGDARHTIVTKAQSRRLK